MDDQQCAWEDVAARFVSARQAARPLARYPGQQPQSLADGYAIQAHAIRLRGGAIGGWKLGRIAEPAASALGTNRLAGPIFADRIRDAADGAPVAMPVIADGFAAGEAEFLLQLRETPDPARTSWGIADTHRLVGRVAIGIEIASSPLGAINDLGPAVTVSDFGNNNGLVIGPDLPRDRWHDLDAIPVTLAINGAQVGAATTATMLDGPWGSLRFLLELNARRRLDLAAGQWISTGAVTGVHRVAPGDLVRAGFGGALAVAARIIDEKEQANGHAR